MAIAKKATVKKVAAKAEPQQVTTSDVVELLYLKAEGQYNKETCRDVAKLFLEALTTAIRLNDRVVISKFGFFTRKTTKPRIGRNPRTGEAVEIAAKQRVLFKASPSLLEKE
jgi:nucleoid DNA-binding protein